jgi:HEAT repeat protein
MSAIGLLLVSGCQKKCKKGEDAACWIAALQDPEQAETAVAELKGLDEKSAEPALITAFSAAADNPKLREEAAEAFKKWKTAAAVKPMIEALDYSIGPDKDGAKAKATNRANQKIATALGAIGDKQAAAPILRLVKVTKNPYVKRAAIRALGELKAAEAVDELLGILEDKDAHKTIRANVVFTLGEIGDPKVIPNLVLALYREKAFFFAHANLALVKIGEPAVDLLIETMNGKNPEVKRILEGNVQVLQGALEANAAQVLGDIGSSRAIDPLLAMVEKVSAWDTDNKLLVMVRLISALGDIGDPRAVKPIMKYLDTEFWDVNTVVANALTYIGDRTVVPELFKYAQQVDKHPRARVPLIDAIGILGTDEALATMKELHEKFKDVTLTPAIENSIKRLEAYSACKQSVDCWIGKLKDQNPAVREKAAFELGQLSDPKSLDALIEVIGDPSELVRWAVIFALGRLNSNKPIAAIDNLVENLEKGNPRFKIVNNKYERLIARLKRTGK